MPQKISVALGERSYPIYTGTGLLKKLGEFIEKHGLKGEAVIVTQREIWAHWRAVIHESLSSRGIVYQVHLPKAGGQSEKMKSSAELFRLIKTCSKVDGRGRGLFLIALGGGVVGDVTGFAAAIYRRGVPCVQVPTTLTAQVDSAIGGKNAIDLPEGKNLLGAIYQPRFVLSDPETLKTLPDRLLRDGLAEVVKYGVITDPGLFVFLEKKRDQILARGRGELERIIASSARTKAKVVSRDEFDKKEVRIVLNFGHTIGHAIEAASGYGKYTHGEAISIGMMCAIELSASLGVLKEFSLPRRLEKLLIAFGLPVKLDKKISVEKMMRAIGYDKKNVDGTNRFVLIEKLGKTVIHRAVPQRLIYDHIQKRRG